MEKSNTLPPRRRKKASRGLRKCCLLMILALMASLQAVCAQNVRVTLHLKDADFAEFITRVKQQTRYTFFYNDRVAKAIEPVTVDKDNVLLEEVLREVLSSKGFDFSIEDRTVIIRKAETSVQQQQETVVRGTVRDEKGQPLPGVTVLLKGTTMGVVSDNDGRYELNLPSVTTLTLVFSFVGMQTQEVKYAGQRELNIVMQEDVAQMDEVIVTGYSTRKVSEMTGAVQQFRGKEIAASATGGNLMNALKGHTTGLQITGSTGRPGQDGDLLLRGLGTLYNESSLEQTSASTPLIVIDGVITDYKSISGVVAPSDVADITVLKDAASTAIYGSRAATGVIVVTTKKGSKDRMNVSLDVKMGINTPTFGGLKYMNSAELLAYGKMSLQNWWDHNESVQGQGRDEFVNSRLTDLYDNFDLTHTTDWRNLAYQTGLSKDVAMSIRGGGENMQYYFSYNYFDEKGTRIGYNLTRHLFKARMDFDVTKFLSFGVNLSGTFEKNIEPNSDESSAGMEIFHPWMTPYNEDGTLKYSIANWKNYQMNPEDKVNVLQDNKYNNLTALQSNLFGSFSGTLKPFSWLTLTSTNTFTLQNSNSNDYKDSRTYSGNNSRNKFSNGTLKVSDSRNWSFLTSNILRLQHSFNEHNLSGLVGQEWYEKHLRGSVIQMYDQTIAGERNVGGFSKQGVKDDAVIPTGTEREMGSFSVFSEVNYNYAEKYMASLSFRTDGSTNFGRDNRYGTFYSVSASWLISREKFMMRQKVISNLKLRASYGTSGKEAGMDYLNYTLYSTGVTTFDYYHDYSHYQSSYAAAINQLGNDRLTWETAHNLNIGLDLGFLNNRISLSADCYRRLNSDLIMNVNLAVANGVGRQYQNVGEMLNRGVELVLNTHTLKSENFNWYTTLTFSYNDNELKKLDQGKLTRNYYKTFYEGDNFDELKKVKVVGINPETGLAQFERVEEDGTKSVVDSYLDATMGNGELSYVNIGLGRAPYWGGFTNTFNYKNWELYVHTTYSLNYKVYNGIKTSYTDGTAWMDGNLYRVPSNWKIWEKPGDLADIPMVNADPAAQQELGDETSFGYTDASHWRISNIRLSYRFPQKWMSAIHLQSAALSFSCDNVYTVTSKEFSGNDPENVNGWASPRSFVFGLNITF